MSLGESLHIKFKKLQNIQLRVGLLGFLIFFVPVPLGFYPSIFFILAIVVFNLPLVFYWRKMQCPKCKKHAQWNPILGKWIWGWSISIPSECSKCGFDFNRVIKSKKP